MKKQVLWRKTTVPKTLAKETKKEKSRIWVKIGEGLLSVKSVCLEQYGRSDNINHTNLRITDLTKLFWQIFQF